MNQNRGISSIAKYSVAILLSLLCVCCILGGAVSNLSKNGDETQTPRPTKISTETPQPTMTSVATSTSSITNYSAEAQAYLDAARPHLLAYSDALTEFVTLSDQATDDPTLFSSSIWVGKVKDQMTVMEDSARGLQSLPTPPEELIETDRWMQRVASETFIMTGNFRTGLDNLDSTYILKAGENMQNITLYLTNALQEIQKAYPNS